MSPIKYRLHVTYSRADVSRYDSPRIKIFTTSISTHISCRERPRENNRERKRKILCASLPSSDWRIILNQSRATPRAFRSGSLGGCKYTLEKIARIYRWRDFVNHAGYTALQRARSKQLAFLETSENLLSCYVPLTFPVKEANWRLSRRNSPFANSFVGFCL